MKNKIALQLIPIKNTLKQSVRFQQISDLVLEGIKIIPNISEHKINLELIELICNIIETFCKKTYKLDKLNLFFYTLKRIDPSLTSDEEDKIKNDIEYLHNNGIIKAISNSQYSTAYIKNFFLKQSPTPSQAPITPAPTIPTPTPSSTS